MYLCVRHRQNDDFDCTLSVIAVFPLKFPKRSVRERDANGINESWTCESGLHRDGGNPSIVRFGRTPYWYVCGISHRLDGQASDMWPPWSFKGKSHRTDGPAQWGKYWQTHHELSTCSKSKVRWHGLWRMHTSRMVTRTKKPVQSHFFHRNSNAFYALAAGCGDKLL